MYYDKYDGIRIISMISIISIMIYILLSIIISILLSSILGFTTNLQYISEGSIWDHSISMSGPVCHQSHEPSVPGNI